MTDLSDLIARLESAQVGSRELDHEIFLATHPDQGTTFNKVTGEWSIVGLDEDGGPWAPGPSYTTSIDDALRLIDPWCPIELNIGVGRTSNDCAVFTPRRWTDEQGRRCTSYDPHEAQSERDGTVYMNTPALVVCIAGLRARQESE